MWCVHALRYLQATLKSCYHIKGLFHHPEDMQGPAGICWELLWRWFSTQERLLDARGNQSWGLEEVLAWPGFQKHEQKLASIMAATIYQDKRGKDFEEEVEETSLHLVTGLSILGKMDFGLQCVKSPGRWRQFTLPHAKVGCLSFHLFSLHRCTPLPPGVSSAFGLGKTKRGICS